MNGKKCSAFDSLVDYPFRQLALRKDTIYLIVVPDKGISRCFYSMGNSNGFAQFSGCLLYALSHQLV